MTWELTRRRFFRAINSKYLFDRIVSLVSLPPRSALQLIPGFLWPFHSPCHCTMNITLTRLSSSLLHRCPSALLDYQLINILFFFFNCVSSSQQIKTKHQASSGFTDILLLLSIYSRSYMPSSSSSKWFSSDAWSPDTMPTMANDLVCLAMR